jgi:NADP-dependent alcohol dehydrogenase
MNNFTFSNPTKILFGEGQIKELAKLLPADLWWRLN